MPADLVPLPPSLTESSELALQLRRVLHRLNRQLRQTSERLGVPPGQYSVLIALLEHSPTTVTHLAEHERVRTPSMTAIVAQMESAGLVSKQPGAADRRFVEIAITPRGAELAQAARQSQGAWFASRLARLPEGEAAAIRHALPFLDHLAQMED